MENFEKMTLYSLLSRISKMPDEVKAEFGVKTVYCAAERSAEIIRKELKHGEKN